MIKMDSTFEEYGADPLFVKRILLTSSRVRKKVNNNEVKRCSNWNVLMNMVDYLKMCHHYILFQNKWKTRLDLSGGSM